MTLNDEVVNVGDDVGLRVGIELDGEIVVIALGVNVDVLESNPIDLIATEFSSRKFYRI